MSLPPKVRIDVGRTQYHTMIPSAEAYVEFVTTPSFEASARKLLTEEDRRQLELLLLANPRRGQVIERTGGFRKVRFARPSRKEGKSGGTRVIYYFIQRNDRIYLIEVYAKRAKDDLTRAVENGLRDVARVLEGES
ncbi:MAG: hypothetical protein ABL963_14255 [Longimicrobiales bacterium]